ncbi:hypothetical protein C1645_823550 [Glomus cerebriforme]|uniref:Uncharacterized protein n=1 Tax=Glomus cerebriforme TaxID=658196 RepID=A0A397T2M0_9GLOM|nr:hypothetical protein C1645_823550 [Glomus cerebriforme]
MSHKFGYKNFVYFTDVILSIFWFVLSIIIVARVNNGSIIDSDNINHGVPDADRSLSLGKAITILSWFQFIIWTFTTVLLAHIRSRKWTKKDRNKRITIVSGHYDQDAKMLNTPAIIKEIDELVRNPQTVQTTKETSSKIPVLELNLSLTENTTTLYSLDPVSTPSNLEDDLYSRALFDYK